MRKLFKQKISKFGSLTSLILLTTMMAIFSLALPEFIFSTSGRIFAVVWSLLAIVVFIAHATRLSVEQRQYIPAWKLKSTLRTKPVQKQKRAMLGG